MKKLLLFAFLTLSFASIARGQTPNGVRSQTFTVLGTSTPINLINTAIAYHKLTWNVVNGTSSVCSVRLDGSANGTTFGAGDVIPAQTCTTNGSSAVVNMIVNYVRIDMTAITVSAGASVVVTWDGWIINPVSGGGVTTLNGLSGAVTLAAGTGITLVPVGNTITINATNASTIGGSIAATQIAVGSGANTISGSAGLTSPAPGYITQTLANTTAFDLRDVAVTSVPGIFFGELFNAPGTQFSSEFTNDSFVSLASVNYKAGGSIDLTSQTSVGPLSNQIALSPTAASTTKSFSAASYLTATNCADSAGAAACGSAAAGSFVVDAAATTTVVSTTAVTANSEIFVQYDSSLGARLGVTCNVTVALPSVTARTAATSFTVTVPVGPITNPACYSFHIVN